MTNDFGLVRFEDFVQKSLKFALDLLLHVSGANFKHWQEENRRQLPRELLLKSEFFDYLCIRTILAPLDFFILVDALQKLLDLFALAAADQRFELLVDFENSL